MVVSGRIELPTHGFSVRCSTDWATKPWRSRRESNSQSPLWQRGMLTGTPLDLLVAGDGFEPTTFRLWAWRATKLLYPAIMADDEGFEPPRALLHLSVFKTDPFNRAWVIIRVSLLYEYNEWFTFFYYWWSLQDSNLQPTDYESGALTNWAKAPYGGRGEIRTHDTPGMSRVL